MVAILVAATALGAWFGSLYTFKAAVAHFSSNPYQSYMDVETENDAFEGGMFGFFLTFFVLFVIGLRRANEGYHPNE